MSDSSTQGGAWAGWIVAPKSGFTVDHPAGHLGLIQRDPKEFLVTTAFRFTDAEIEQDLFDQLRAAGRSDDDARRAIDDARTFTPTDENPTDLASIPIYMRWFANPYGLHTLAAILHDELITKEVNGGALGSDTLADRFFRRMMGRAGVPWLKRWIMWAAVALRSRFAAGGHRRLSVVLWVVLAAIGISSFVVAVGELLFDWEWAPDTGLLLGVAIGLPFASSPLWGEQYGASLVAAIAALWILPAALFGIVGQAVYELLERIARRAGFD